MDSGKLRDLISHHSLYLCQLTVAQLPWTVSFPGDADVKEVGFPGMRDLGVRTSPQGAGLDPHFEGSCESTLEQS